MIAFHPGLDQPEVIETDLCNEVEEESRGSHVSIGTQTDLGASYLTIECQTDFSENFVTTETQTEGIT